MLEDFKLKVFMAIAETGSFTKAAKVLGVSQPAISQNISALEKELGATLICRARGEAYLSEEGRTFKEYVSHILYWYSAAKDMFGEEGKMTAGKPVRINAHPVVASYLLPDALSILSGTHPETTFSISAILPQEEKRHDDNLMSSHFGTSEESFQENDIPGSHFGTPEDAEVEISVAPSPKTMDFEGEYKLIGVMDAIVVASKENRSVKKAAVSDDDSELTSKPFSTIAGIPVTNRFAVWDGYRQFFTSDLIARTSLISCSIEAIKSMVKDSVSLVGIVPAISVRREIASGELLQMPVMLPDFTFDIHFNPLPEFSGKGICKLLRKTLRDNL